MSGHRLAAEVQTSDQELGMDVGQFRVGLTSGREGSGGRAS